jgi:hypothetical protein
MEEERKSERRKSRTSHSRRDFMEYLACCAQIRINPEHNLSVSLRDSSNLIVVVVGEKV